MEGRWDGAEGAVEDPASRSMILFCHTVPRKCEGSPMAMARSHTAKLLFIKKLKTDHATSRNPALRRMTYIMGAVNMFVCLCVCVC